MSAGKLTEWLPGTWKPTLPGVYQRKFPWSPEAVFWALWTGRLWMAGHRVFRGKDLAYEDTAAGIARAAAETIPSFSSASPWRGLAEAPR